MSKERIIESYPTRPIRISDEVWERLKQDKKRSGLSWNQFLELLNKLYNKKI
jgi:predicted CopG family antitoxin